jgi:hypothetical protein
MPTHTPSPHRFIAPNPLSTQKPKPKPQSSLRNGFTVQTPKPDITTNNQNDVQSRKLTPAKRFVIAPHRRTPSGNELAESKDYEEAQVLVHSQLTPRPKLRRKFERIESIEEPQSSPDAPLHDTNSFGIVQSVEHERLFGDNEAQQEEDEDDDEMLFVTEEHNKRRRISPHSSSPSRGNPEPTTPIAPHNSTTHRFVVPPPRSPALFSGAKNLANTASLTPATTATTPAPHRPAFILPPQPTSPTKASRPLPEIFSPSRKTQRYVPNGLASTLQGWIIETANTGFAAQERVTIGGVVWGRDREDGVKLKVHVTAASLQDANGEVECFPGQFVFVHGDDETRVLLAGQGGARGAGGVKIRVGGVVGIRAPMWDVDVGGDKWVFGVDWVVL